jgi:hypothetical protein
VKVIATEGSDKESNNEESDDEVNDRKASNAGMTFQMICQECKHCGRTWMLAWPAWALVLGVELHVQLNGRMIVSRACWKTNVRSRQKTWWRLK